MYFIMYFFTLKFEEKNYNTLFIIFVNHDK